MKHIILFILFFAGSISLSYSQNYIDQSKSKARERLEKSKTKEKNIHIIIEETDNSLAFLIRDTAVQNLDFLLYFDSKGKCYKEKSVFTCDSCYQKFIARVLKDKYSRWTKIDSTTYFARFPFRMMLYTKIEEPFSFEIRRSEMDGKAYRKTVRDALNN